MADAFSTCLTFTLAQEGGYVDDPQDPGGATNMGITLATLRHWDHDPALSPSDIRAMDNATAAAIYGALFWNTLQATALPPGVDLCVFDFGVNAGTRRSAELLQQALGLQGSAVDGCVGPSTLRSADNADPGQVVADLIGRQEAYYRGLAEFDRYGHGWLARTERRHQAALAMLSQGVDNQALTSTAAV